MLLNPQQKKAKFSDIARIAFVVICVVSCVMVALQHSLLSSTSFRALSGFHRGGHNNRRSPAAAGEKVQQQHYKMHNDDLSTLLHPQILLSYYKSSTSTAAPPAERKSDRGDNGDSSSSASNSIEQPKFAYVTYVAFDEEKQILAVTALMLSLAQTNSRHDRVIFVSTPAVPDRTCELLARFARVIKVEGTLIESPAGSQIGGDRPGGPDEEMYLLLNSLIGLVQCWKLTMYDRVAFVPLGTLALRNMDDMFDVPGVVVVDSGAADAHFSAAPQFKTASIVLLAPNKYVFDVALPYVIRAADVEGVEVFVRGFLASRAGTIAELNVLSRWYLARHFRLSNIVDGDDDDDDGSSGDDDADSKKNSAKQQRRRHQQKKPTKKNMHQPSAGSGDPSRLLLYEPEHLYSTEEHEEMLINRHIDVRVRAIHVALSNAQQLSFFRNFAFSVLSASPAARLRPRTDVLTLIKWWSTQITIMSTSSCEASNSDDDDDDAGSSAALWFRGVAGGVGSANHNHQYADINHHNMVYELLNTQSRFLLDRCAPRAPDPESAGFGHICFLKTSLMTMEIAPDSGDTACSEENTMLHNPIYDDIGDDNSDDSDDTEEAALPPGQGMRNITLVCGICLQRTREDIVPAAANDDDYDEAARETNQKKPRNVLLPPQQRRTFDIVDCGAAATVRYGCVDATCQVCSGSIAAVLLNGGHRLLARANRKKSRHATSSGASSPLLHFFGTVPANPFVIVDEFKSDDIPSWQPTRSTAFAQGACQDDTTMFHCIDEDNVLVTWCAGGFSCTAKCKTIRVQPTQLLQAISMPPPASIPPLAVQHGSSPPPLWLADLWTVRCEWRSEKDYSSGMSAKLVFNN